MEVRFGPDGLFQPPRADSLAPVLAACLRERATLQLSFDGEGASLRLQVPEPTQATAIRWVGWWRSDVLQAGVYGHPGALLLAPFFFAFESIMLPAAALVRLPPQPGSVADLFARNLLLAALRRRPFSFEVNTHHGPESLPSRRLRQTCLDQLRPLLGTGQVHDANAMDLLLANAHLPVGYCGSPLLEHGLQEFRNVAEAHERRAAC